MRGVFVGEGFEFDPGNEAEPSDRYTYFHNNLYIYQRVFMVYYKTLYIQLPGDTCMDPNTSPELTKKKLQAERELDERARDAIETISARR